MKDIIIFGGTTEGRHLAEYCSRNGIYAHVLVAGEYGESLVSGLDKTDIVSGRKDREEIEAYLREFADPEVYDTTHPYAYAVSKNIKMACEKLDIPYLRILREEAMKNAMDTKDLMYFDSLDEAVEYLKNTEGRIFISTGSKDIAAYSSLNPDRLYARVLPSVESMEACIKAGIKNSNIIALQGPFSTEMNAAMLRQYCCEYMVMKDSGTEGGTDTKLKACADTGTKALIIGRAEGESGISEQEATERIAKNGVIRLSIVGIGPGGAGQLTAEALNKIKAAGFIAGAGRMLELAHEIRGGRSAETVSSYKRPELLLWSRKIIDRLSESGRSGNIVFLMSGDTGFYSGAEGMYSALLQLKDEYSENGINFEVEICPGISSLSYMAAAFGMSWNDMELASLHGRSFNILDRIEHNRKLFVLTGGGSQVSELMKQLVKKGYRDIEVCVGENLNYPNEKLTRAKAGELAKRSFADLCALIIINDNARARQTRYLIKDADFIRDKVPMTKEEVRAVSVDMLGLNSNSVCYDIGAGTGSVSIELARAVYEGKVYAVEKKSEACELIKKNMDRFAVDNIEVLEGEATEMIAALPAPTHAFIGGSMGKLSLIADMIYQKNPEARIVINAISLETISELTVLIKKFENRGYTADVSLISVSKTRKSGSYNMMMGNNPVMVACLRPEGNI